MKRFYVSRNGKKVGPFTLEDVVEKIKSKDVDLLDHVHDGSGQDWVILAEHAEIMSQLKAGKSPAPEKPSEQDISEWYLMKGETRFGPFSYGEMVRMLQEKIAFGFDFAWHGGLSGWKRISDIADFQESAIRNLLKDKKQAKDIFVERKYDRHDHNGHLIVHDLNKWWKGRVSEISSGGVGVVMDNAMIVPGQRLYLHFRPQAQFPAFNATGEVVNKKYIETLKAKSEPVQYGIRFLSLSGSEKDRLVEILKDPAA